METLIIQLPRGRTAVVRFDPAQGQVTTNHAGVRASFLAHGVRNVDGHLVFPREGRPFLVALFDRLFLSGYSLRWLWPRRAPDWRIRSLR